MYPNIILSQRLQPYAVVKPENCNNCIWKSSSECQKHVIATLTVHQCQRKMKWAWKAEKYPLPKSQIDTIKNQLAVETHTLRYNQSEVVIKGKKWSDLTLNQRNDILIDRIKTLSRKTTGGKFKIPLEQEKEDIVCQRAASFYVDTVRDFRDRRGEYKLMKKLAELRLEKATIDQKQAALNEVLLFESLQLAHKCILNSFYGYVMRKGARWFSLEMAAIVTNTGADVIKRAK